MWLKLAQKLRIRDLSVGNQHAESPEYHSFGGIYSGYLSVSHLSSLCFSLIENPICSSYCIMVTIMDSLGSVHRDGAGNDTQRTSQTRTYCSSGPK